jgi:3-phosphoshikimate 1-carboxyvinyltransferase
MKAIVQPSNLKGTVTAAASKSAMQRACAAALVRTGQSILANPGVSADDQAALNIIQQLGATVEHTGGTVIINSNGVKPMAGSIHCGESGLSVRMFTSIAAVGDKAITINGSGSLLKRPLAFFNEVLPQLDVACESDKGFLPLHIKGPLHPKDIEVDGSLSSQFLTGLLFAYGAAGARDVTITVKNLNSKPYIDLSLQIMTAFGLKTPVNNGYREFYFNDQLIPASPDKTINYAVEADWSGAAFLLVAGAISGTIIVKGLDVFSTQADKAVLRALMQAEAIMSIKEDQIEIRESKLKAFHFDATDCPDLFPPLVTLAAYCEGTSVIEGVHRLTHKESNRALTLQQEFEKMGVEIKLQDDLMLIKGTPEVRGAVVTSHHDHRIAMACGVAALKAKGEMVIEGAEAVDKSYPQFWDHLAQLNAEVSLKHN